MDEMTLYDLLIDAGLTEEQINEILTLGAIPGQGSIAEQQYEAGQQLRRTPWPRGRWTGRTYSRAHPLEHAAAAAERVIGGVQSRQALDQQQQLLQRQAQLRAAMFRHMYGGGSGGPNPVTPAPGAAAPIIPGSMTPHYGGGGPMTRALRRIDPYR